MKNYPNIKKITIRLFFSTLSKYSQNKSCARFGFAYLMLIISNYFIFQVLKEDYILMTFLKSIKLWISSNNIRPSKSLLFSLLNYKCTLFSWLLVRNFGKCLDCYILLPCWFWSIVYHRYNYFISKHLIIDYYLIMCYSVFIKDNCDGIIG